MNITDAITWESLTTVGGGSIAITLVTNVLGSLVPGFDGLRKYVAFVLALALSVGVAANLPDASMSKWILAVLNGFLIYATSVGLNQVGSAAGGGGGGGGPHPAPAPAGGGGGASGGARPFFRSWL